MLKRRALRRPLVISGGRVPWRREGRLVKVVLGVIDEDWRRALRMSRGEPRRIEAPPEM